MSPPLDRSISSWSLSSAEAASGAGWGAGDPGEPGAAGVPGAGGGEPAEAGGGFSVCSCEGTRREVSLIGPPLRASEQAEGELLPQCTYRAETGIYVTSE